MNICIITLDSLRYDTAIEANTPNIDSFGKWTKAGAQGTYTLPAHMALFMNGKMPVTTDGRKFDKSKRWFWIDLPWDNGLAEYQLPEGSPNIVKGFEALGHETIGIGGVRGWFNNEVATGAVWSNYFFESYMWLEEFSESSKNGFRVQISFLENYWEISESEKLFLFINVAATHTPYLGGKGIEGQIESLEYIDRHFIRLIELLPKPCHVFMFSDHGDCIEKIDGIEGHGFAHPVVMTVPIMEFKL